MSTLTWESPDKKYLVMFKEDTGAMKAHRYGEAWRDLNGDGMVLSMLHDLTNKKVEIECLRKQNERLAQELQNCRSKCEYLDVLDVDKHW